MSESTPPRALISGASIAGPALAFWLARAGWQVTLVERAAHVRGGGYPIDLRGTAVEVVKRMGIYDEVRKNQVGRRSTEILNPRGRRIATIDVSADVLNNDETGDVELPRGSLAVVLYEHTRNVVQYFFNDSVATIDAGSDHVDVTFVSGRVGSFDVVIGADGIHSTTRRIAFGPERDYIHHLGPCVAIFDMDGSDVQPGDGTMFNLPGRLAMQMRDSTGPNRGFLAFVVENVDKIDTEDTRAACALARTVFDDQRSEHVRGLLDGMEQADDVFFDTVSQIRMNPWHRGRVALVGDSAYAPSFLSGQGTSIAVIGAYVLATELVTKDDPLEAFAAYEDKLRDFIAQNQDLALRAGSTSLPRDKKSLRRRNVKLRAAPWLNRLGLMKLLTKHYRETSTGLSIEGYGLT